MNDNYMHLDSSVIYTTENIPGPTEYSSEYEEIINSFNSQVSDHCTCGQICEVDTCKCLQKSGGHNYISYKENGKLKSKLNKSLKTYPTIECNSSCSCSVNCGNRLVQKGPVKGLDIRCEIPCKGFGLFTTEIIPNGTFICEYAGELLTSSQAEMRSDLNQLKGRKNFIFCLREVCKGNVTRTFVDPSYFGNIGRYLNHSCEPNCLILPVRCEMPIPKIAIFACEDIMSNTEITMNYGTNNLSYIRDSLKGTRTVCLCGSNNCKGFLPCESF